MDAALSRRDVNTYGSSSVAGDIAAAVGASGLPIVVSPDDVGKGS